MTDITIYLTIQEIEDVLKNLDQCKSEGYISFDDPAWNVYEKLKTIIDKLTD